MKKEIFAYIRTSNTDKAAAAKSDSDAHQLKTIKQFCQLKDWIVKDAFYDLRVSGDNGGDFREREAFSEMLAEMKSNGVKTFVVADAKCFAKSIITAAIIGEDLRAYGLAAMDASTGKDLAAKSNDNPEEQMIQNILMCLAQYDKVKIVSRLQGARRRKKKAGGYIGGTIPFGQHENDKELAARIKALRAIFKTDDGKRMTKTRITKTLNDEGFTNRRGKKLSLQTVSDHIKSLKAVLIGGVQTIILLQTVSDHIRSLKV